jgi:glycosyltransferase involved in cell wall biosynthesis
MGFKDIGHPDHTLMQFYLNCFKILCMKHLPSVSVIMHSWNCGRFIERAIESIISQTFSDFELIIIEDASTDNTIEKIGKYLPDIRVRLIRLNENRGKYYARNLGISEALGDFIAVMDANDIADMNRLFIQYNYLRNNALACISSQGYFIDSENNIIGDLDNPADPDILKVSFLKRDFTSSSSLFFDKKLLSNYGLSMYNTQFGIGADYDFIVNCSNFFSIHNLPDRLVYKRVQQGQITTKEADDHLKAVRLVRASQLRRLGVVSTKMENYVYNLLMEQLFLSQDELHLAVKFLNKIVRRNSKLKIYNEVVVADFFQSIVNHAQKNSNNNYWSLDDDVFDLIEAKIPVGSKIIEFGSGSGTTRLLSKFKVTSIEHDFRFIVKRCKEHKVFHVPIENGWYNNSMIKNLVDNEKFDLMIIDGPPGELRLGIVKNLELFNHIDCPMIFDDIDREGDEIAMKLFCDKFGYESQVIKSANKSFAFCVKS